MSAGGAAGKGAKKDNSGGKAGKTGTRGG